MLKLTHSEVDHILTLIENNAREGWYYGNRETYWRISDRIKAKLQPLSPQAKREAALALKADVLGENGNG